MKCVCTTGRPSPSAFQKRGGSFRSGKGAVPHSTPMPSISRANSEAGGA